MNPSESASTTLEDSSQDGNRSHPARSKAEGPEPLGGSLRQPDEWRSPASVHGSDGSRGRIRPPNRAEDTLKSPARGRLEIVLPNSHDPPAAGAQSAGHLQVSSPVGLELRAPEIGPRLRPDPVPRTTVPEAAIDKDSQMTSRKDKIRST
jgi:hypothetical protein